MNDFDRRALLGAAGLVSVSALAGRAHSGPLDPPAGPVISTGKTIAEAEPRTALSSANTPGDATSLFRITTPGGYYLTGNLVVPPGVIGIKVSATNVTIDLNGFTISGPSTATAAISSESGSLERISIRNGYITGTANGISLASNAGVRIEDLMVDSAATDGVAVGLHCIVSRCRVTRSGRYGFSYGNGAVFTDCIARANGTGTSGAGFRASSASSLPLGSTTFTSCLSEGNLGLGIQAFGPATVENCVAINNATYGFLFGQGPSAVRACIAQFNGGAGFTASLAVIEGCYSGDNTGAGFDCIGPAVLRGCYAKNNTGVGISFGGSSVLEGNNVGCSSTNIPAAIRGGGTGSRIEGNHTQGGQFGIQILVQGGNTVIGNTVMGAPTAYALPAGTVYGPIIDRTSPGSPAVNGSSAASALGTIDPFANFAL